MKRLEYSSGPGTRFYPGRLLPVRNADVGVASFVVQVGNFNVADLVNANGGTVTAQHECGLFEQKRAIPSKRNSGVIIRSGRRNIRQPVGFRKARRAGFHSHPPQIQPLPETARTCFEGPFGEVLRATGPMAKVNPFRFSTKYQDDETDLLYYGYRYYNASMGRWVSRDPVEENGGANLYVLIGNQTISRLDYLGLLTATGGSPNTSIIRHNNYLTFTITCPKCSIFVFNSVDYSGVLSGLHDIGLSDARLQLAFGTFNGQQDLGGELDEKSPNCNGKPVRVRVYMRTRLTNQDYLNYLFLTQGMNGFPSVSADATVKAYAAGTVVDYDCVPCSNRRTMPWWP